MTINYTQPGDVASQVYNEARRSGESHEEAVTASFQAMQHAKNNQDGEEITNVKPKTKN